MSKHAIIVIKDENKYLQYYDERWNSYLFPNCKVYEDEKSDVINYLKESFNLKEDNIECNYIGYKKHSKFSVSHNMEKEYEHYFYSVKFINTKIDYSKYKWFSYEELINDVRIMKVNSDIVNYIKEFQI